MYRPGIATTDSPPDSVPACVIPIRPPVISSKSAIPGTSEISTSTGSTAVPVIRSHVESTGRFTSTLIPSVGGDVI